MFWVLFGWLLLFWVGFGLVLWCVFMQFAVALNVVKSGVYHNAALLWLGERISKEEGDNSL